MPHHYDDGQAMAEMPKYRCHKEVHALKISVVTENENRGTAVLTPEGGLFAEISVDEDFVKKHRPQPGGYYVVYKDGYKSFSPADAFEDGYARI